MRALLKRFGAIAGLTLLETLRQPILLLLTTTCVLGIGVLPMLLLHTMGEARKLVQDSALALHFVCGLLLGAQMASTALGRETRRGTLASVLSKPVEREIFYAAKFAGLAGMLGLFSLAAGMATVLATRMAEDPYTIDWLAGGPLVGAIVGAFLVAAMVSYYTHRPFGSTAFLLLVALLGVALIVPATRGPMPWGIVPASVLVSLATLLLAALALALITRLDLVPTLAVCAVIFLLGLMSDYLLGRAAGTNRVAALAYNLLPNWQHFWLADALHRDEGRIPWGYVGQAAAYGVFYLLGSLSLGMLAFRNVESSKT